MFGIEYTSGLTVSVTVTASPGSGSSWISGDPVISWGDGTTTTHVLNGRAYSHTYSSYGTYTISLEGENECGGICGDEKSITLVEECPEIIIRYPNTPEISFDGTTATCRIYVDAGAGETPVMGGTSIIAYNGKEWVQVADQLNFSLRIQTVDLTWEMVAGTDWCMVGGTIVNSCGSSSSKNTSHYSYTVCPVPTCSFRIN